MNLDHTTRSTEVNDQVKLFNGVVSVFDSFRTSPDIVSLVEVSGQSIVTRLRDDTDYNAVAIKNGYRRGGYNVIAWDHGLYEVDYYNDSACGRYGSVMLKERTPEQPLTFCHIAVHLPTKGHWKRSAKLVLQHVEDVRREGADAVTIAGDFNRCPASVAEIFTEDLGFVSVIPSTRPTTKKGNCIDNIIVDDRATACTYKVRSDIGLFSHFPVTTTVYYEK